MTTQTAAPARAATFLDALAAAVRDAATYNKQDQTPPAAVLWPDKERQWEPLVPRLREHLPLYVLGPYRPDARSGPAIWLRCVTERSLLDAAPMANEIPVIYLPGVSRQDVRAVESCPRELQPLAELQYRGTLWTQKNARDWTIAAFLQAGLGLNVAADTATRDALQTALLQLADQPLERLRREGFIRAPFLNGLLHPDEVGTLLRWLNDPDGFRSQCDAAGWAAFRAVSQAKYDVDPDSDGPAPAVRRLAERQGNWDLAWQRFAEAPAAYPALPDRLRQARPAKVSPLFDAGAYPQDNEAAETELRTALAALANATQADAVARIKALEEVHGVRRDFVWAKLGQAPLAQALASLAELARLLAGGVLGQAMNATPQALVDDYLDRGWRIDAAVLRSLACVEQHKDVTALHAAVRALYGEWLDNAARLMQDHVRASGDAAYARTASPSLLPGTCLLFSDGLRYDLARALAEQLAQHGLAADLDWRMTALPSITATAKPAVTPIANHLGSGPGLEPTYGGSKVTVQVLRRALTDAGHQVLGETDLGEPSGTAWTERGEIDAYGHQHGWQIAQQIERELRSLRERIAALLDHGWQRVVVVTDHGWLLLPGGLPKSELPEYLTETRKGRCARLKPVSTTSELTHAWRWDPNVLFAFAPGSACFEAGREYEHGGISPQECITPVLRISRAAAASAVTIHDVSWRRLVCRVSLAGAVPGLSADLRTRTADPASSLVFGGAKPVGSDGAVSLPALDEYEQAAAIVVVVNASGAVVTYTSTTVGG